MSIRLYNLLGLCIPALHIFPYTDVNTESEFGGRAIAWTA